MINDEHHNNLLLFDIEFFNLQKNLSFSREIFILQKAATNFLN